ncbi:MAG: hypothetical protein Q9160_000765 [Pyrenula sp. 1 TL-2023]
MTSQRSLRQISKNFASVLGGVDDSHGAVHNDAADSSANTLMPPVLKPEKNRVTKVYRQRSSPSKRKSMGKSRQGKRSQLPTPPSTAESSQSLEESPPETLESEGDSRVVSRSAKKRKRTTTKHDADRKNSRQKVHGTYRNLSTSKKELKLIDSIGGSKTEEDGDGVFRGGSYDAGIWIKVGLPREGLRRRGPEPKAERMKFTNRHNFAFGYDPFPKHKVRNIKTYKKVLDALINFHGRAELGLEIDQATDMPVHAGEHITVHAIIKVIMSQATMNDNAETALASLSNHFRHGETRKLGKIPNYHKVRVCPLSELEEVIKPAGFWRKRARAIQGILNLVYRENLEQLGLEDGTPEANAANGQDTLKADEDFVEGLLSVDWLREIQNMQELFDRLTRFEFLGVKTIMCIMGFNLRLPCFAVDTHVYRLSDMLNWFPHKANIDKAAMHLNFHIPNEIKYELHQAFWHHGRNCIRCKTGSNEATAGYRETVCPIEKFKVRDWDYDRKIEGKSVPNKREATGGDYVDEVDADDAFGAKQAETPKKTKAQARNSPKSVKSKKAKEVDEGEVRRKGFIKLEVDISDNFGVSRPDNIGKKIVWVVDTQRSNAMATATNTRPGLVQIDLEEGRYLYFRGIVIQHDKATKVLGRFLETGPTDAA